MPSRSGSDPRPDAPRDAILDGVTLAIGPEAVVIESREPLRAASTAVVSGGLTSARAAHEFGGPASKRGWCVARATREALVPAIGRWTRNHP